MVRWIAVIALVCASATVPEAYACKCAPLPGLPRCGLDADDLESMAPRRFVGRVTSVAPKDWQQYMAMLVARVGPDFLDRMGGDPSEEERQAACGA